MYCCLTYEETCVTVAEIGGFTECLTSELVLGRMLHTSIDRGRHAESNVICFVNGTSWSANCSRKYLQKSFFLWVFEIGKPHVLFDFNRIYIFRKSTWSCVRCYSTSTMTHIVERIFLGNIEIACLVLW